MVTWQSARAAFSADENPQEDLCLTNRNCNEGPEWVALGCYQTEKRLRNEFLTCFGNLRVFTVMFVGRIYKYFI